MFMVIIIRVKIIYLSVIKGIMNWVIFVICLMFLKIIKVRIIINFIVVIVGLMLNVLLILSVMELDWIFGIKIFIVISVVIVNKMLYYFIFVFFLM